MGLRDSRIGLPGQKTGAATPVAARRVISQDYITETEITPAGTPVTIALADGTDFVEIENLGATTENIRFAWGTSSADSITNLGISGGLATTGEKIYAYADKPLLSFVERDRPIWATHLSICNAVAAQTPDFIAKQGSY